MINKMKRYYQNYIRKIIEWQTDDLNQREALLNSPDEGYSKYSEPVEPCIYSEGNDYYKHNDSDCECVCDIKVEEMLQRYADGKNNLWNEDLTRFYQK